MVKRCLSFAGLVCLTIVAFLGCAGMIKYLPVAVAKSSHDSASVGEDVLLDASDSYDPKNRPLLYHWDFGDNTESDEMVVRHAWGQPGVYIVTLTVTDQWNFPVNTTLEIEILPSNQPPISNAGTDQTVVLGDLAYFDGSGSADPEGGNLDYSWDFGDGTFGTGSAPEHLYESTGDYTVSLTVYDDSGLESTDTVTVSVVTDLFEPDDIPAEASVIAIGTANAQKHALNPAEDVDWIYFYAEAGHSYEIETLSAGTTDADTVLKLYAGDGTTELAANDNSSGMFSLIEYTFSSSGTYYVVIQNASTSALGDYIVQVVDTSGSLGITIR